MALKTTATAAADTQLTTICLIQINQSTIIRLHQMHEMLSIVTDVCDVCLLRGGTYSVCRVRRSLGAAFAKCL